MKLGWIGFGGPSEKVDEALAAYEVSRGTYLPCRRRAQAAAAELIEHGATIRESIILALCAPQPCVPAQPRGGSPALDVLRVEADGRRSSRCLNYTVRNHWSSTLEKDNVLVHPGYFFDFARDAFIVVSLLVEPATFDQAIGRVMTRAAAVSS